jgi:hypothetical protein
MAGLTPCCVTLGGDTVSWQTHRPLGADPPRTNGLVITVFRAAASPFARVGLDR